MNNALAFGKKFDNPHKNLDLRDNLLEQTFNFHSSFRVFLQGSIIFNSSQLDIWTRKHLSCVSLSTLCSVSTIPDTTHISFLRLTKNGLVNIMVIILSL